MKFNPESIHGYSEALHYIRALPDGQAILQREQSVDGWTVCALANSLWEQGRRSERDPR